MASKVVVLLVNIVCILILARVLFGILPESVTFRVLLIAGAGVVIIGVILKVGAGTRTSIRGGAGRNAKKSVPHVCILSFPIPIRGKAPVENGGHTEYMYQICYGCMCAVIVEKEDYLSTTDEHRQQVRVEFAELGITLIEP